MTLLNIKKTIVANTNLYRPKKKKEGNKRNQQQQKKASKVVLYVFFQVCSTWSLVNDHEDPSHFLFP